MKLVACRITQFASFRETQEFIFPDAPGLYFLWGHNEQEPRLGSNGAGKTSVWNALTWLVYGKTAKGVRAGDVANWEGERGTAVELDMLLEGTPMTLRRTHQPNSFTLEGTEGRQDLDKDSDNVFASALRLEFSAFLHCVLMAQGRAMFLDLSASMKASVFSDVMGLEKWTERSDRAQKESVRLDNELRALEKQSASVAGRIASYDPSNLQRLFDTAEDTKRRKLDGILDEYGALLRRQKTLEERQKEAETETEKRRTRYADSVKTQESLQTTIERTSMPCVTCGQLAPSDASLTSKLKQATRATVQLLSEYTQAQAVEKSYRLDIAAIGKTLDTIEDRAEALENEPNPYEDLLKTTRTQVAVLTEEREGVEKALSAGAVRLSIVSGWVRWYKEIRLSLIGDALEELELEVGNALVELGLTGWGLRFDTDRETKTGTLTRGFSVGVFSPHNTTKSVPWEVWSGGEAQRLRIATQMGLSNLIRSQTGTVFPLETWDEPTQGMTAQGIADLLDSLKQRAIAEQRQIWVVDHTQLGFSDFDGEKGVVKTKQGSVFKEGPYISAPTTSG